MDEKRLDEIRSEVASIDTIDRRRMPRQWQENLEFQRKSLVAEYFRVRCEPPLEPTP